MNKNYEKFFSRHIELIGKDGFEKLQNSCVLVAGVGGLGTVVSELLVRIGVGKLVIIDNGIIDEPDLNRQFFYSYKDIGKLKVEVAYKRLKEIFPQKNAPEIISFKENITSSLLANIINNYSINAIADCVDNFNTKFLLDEFSKQNNIFFVHGGVNSFFGQILISKTHLSELFFNLDSKTVSVDKIYPPICFIIGSLMASEIIKFITNKAFLSIEKILSIDLYSNDFSSILLK